jgi:hypothetical protein
MQELVMSKSKDHVDRETRGLRNLRGRHDERPNDFVGRVGGARRVGRARKVGHREIVVTVRSVIIFVIPLKDGIVVIPVWRIRQSRHSEGKRRGGAVVRVVYV